MNKSALKKYAPQARKDFITAVSRRAETLGLNPQSPGTVEHDGDVMLINGQPFPADLERQRTTLQRRIAEQGFAQVMDAMAYTWFNRLVAIRYMELHGFLDHGYRVLSHPANQATGHAQPEILEDINELDLPGLDRSRALELKLAGNRDEELYREVLLAQCHALHKAMPFLFESLDDATELLLPDGLLRTDSILGKLVTTIDEADWQDVEIIGWLYQFYISEKKDQVIGKVVKSEDIPAATQLFTPNWIVKYLVQNSLGRLWLMANPTSQLATKWEYCIKPAEQTDEVNAQLDALIQARIDEDGATLNPESLTLLDPACGSGHILVEAYDLLRDIYLERGYRRHDIPRLILEKNLYGLDIDDRAAQLAGFALLMKARADDRRLFGQPVALNVLALQEAKEGSAADLHSALNAPQISYSTVSQLVETYEQAKTFGSLIQIPDDLASALPDLRRELEALRDGGDMLGRDAAETLLRLAAQAEVLAMQFDAVVANPPYMGVKYQAPILKKFLARNYSGFEKDLFSAFIKRCVSQCVNTGFYGVLSPFVWLFISSYEDLRKYLIHNAQVLNLVQLEYNAFEPAMIPVGAFCGQAAHVSNYLSSFIRLADFKGHEQQASRTTEAIRNPDVSWHLLRKMDELASLPRHAFSYWAGEGAIKAFSSLPSLGETGVAASGIQTSDNEKYLRLWHEVDFSKVNLDRDSCVLSDSSRMCWIPHLKGGSFRRWYGNYDWLIKWNLSELRADKKVQLKNMEYQRKESVTWSHTSSSSFSVRYGESYSTFNVEGPVYLDPKDPYLALAYMASNVSLYFMNLLNPTLHFLVGNVKDLPYCEVHSVTQNARSLVEIFKDDWDAYERSFGFQRPKILSSWKSTISKTYRGYAEHVNAIAANAKALEEENNIKFISAFSLENELKPEVDLSEITLTCNPLFRYGGAQEDVEKWERFRKDTVCELVSYAVGCMMGRYSLDAPGLIYAHAGNEGFDPSRYQTFPADDDGIVPITDEAWFDDDGANRIREFVRVVWGEDTEAENMAWLAESLGSKASESADDTIRRYLSRDFYKDHLQTYKKRPIYWLFSSGKYKAFEALVYLHRYNAGTLSRMRMEYIVPLQSRMQARIDSLEQDITAATSSAETKRLQKQRDKLTKQLDELRRYDENLRHYADQRITLDLDDGVKVNYGKFGDLLAEVKAVTGKKA